MDFSYDPPTINVTGNNSPMINYRKDAKKGVKFTFMVVGELGTGKTTFVNSLLSKKVLSHRYEAHNSGNGSSLGETKTLAFTSSKSVALPNTAILTRQEFNPNTVNEEPGIALTETKVEMVDDDNLKLLLNIIDSPGFGENLNNELCFVEIENYLKQQFDLVLAEETRIKRNPRFVDTRVHVLLYFITPTGHGLREIDIQCMKRLSKYVNIIPIIGKADSFTELELKHFKSQIKVDIEKFNVPIFQFDNYVNEYDEEDDQELIQESKFLSQLQPFAIIASEKEFEVKDPKSGKTRIIKARQYPWGLVDINDPKHSDFPVLKSVLLGSHLQDLKDLTHDFLYETYRTERLSKVTGVNSRNDEDYDESEFHDTVEHHTSDAGSHYANSTLSHAPTNVPSLSNLALIVNQGSTTAFSTQNNTMLHEDDRESVISSSSGKKARSMLLDDENSNEMPSPKLKDSPSFPTADEQTYNTNGSKHDLPPPRNLNPNNAAFKRLSIGPQRNQLRQLSETVPYVIRHERILERQQKLEEMEMASAKELASRAALLEQKAAELKGKEKLLMKRFEAEKQRKITLSNAATEHTEIESPTKSFSGNGVHIDRDETLTDLHAAVQ